VVPIKGHKIIEIINKKIMLIKFAFFETFQMQTGAWHNLLPNSYWRIRPRQGIKNYTSNLASIKVILTNCANSGL